MAPGCDDANRSPLGELTNVSTPTYGVDPGKVQKRRKEQERYERMSEEQIKARNKRRRDKYQLDKG